MSGDELDAAARDLVGRSDGLLRVAGVILDDSLNLLSQHPTGSIEVAYGHFETALHLLAEGRVLPSNRPDGRDRNAFPGIRLHEKPYRDGDDDDRHDSANDSFHPHPPENQRLLQAPPSRSEERRLGKECASTCRTRRAP